ncbi:DEAD/DEAH box helicase [Acinetobacter baumannii]|nr:DEAD/DEAH box helicase family protein [Acinetobacter baumannii]
MTQFTTGQWVWSEVHQQAGKVIEHISLWGEDLFCVWLTQSDQVIKLPFHQLQSLAAGNEVSPAYIAYVAAASRVANSQNGDTLLAPMSSNVIPLPHQLKCLNRALNGLSRDQQVRYLLADEVGLGKTIEAGLIMRELKLRGLVKRILVVAPKGLATQWVSEMLNHFNEVFTLISPADAVDLEDNVWIRHDQVICSMDSIKPLEKRRGWSLDKINQYNQQRFDGVISAGWDLIIVDESHRLQGSTDTVARYKLGQGLSDAAPYFLLLSATPHQGKTDGFHRLMSLLDREAFPDLASINQERVKPYVIRTEKRQAIDGEGQPLFKPRRTELKSVAWQAQHQAQQALYHAVTEYVREGYNQAVKTKQNAIGFLMILMQRLVVSSPSAIKSTLERRLAVLNRPSLAQQESLLTNEEWEDLDGQQQVDALLNHKELTRQNKALRNEQQEVEWLLSLASQCVENGIDAKADTLLELMNTLQREENDPNLKILIFTEFVPTQSMLAEFLTSRGISVVTLNGSMNMEQRKQVQQDFAAHSRVLISTDAGGEGLNLQFCHVIVNYDIPWNPMRLEQRIGRVDRIGQKHVVRAINLVFEDTVEHRVREVLEEKLNIILEEFGVDKTSDVLDSAQAGQLFDELYTNAIQNPDIIDQEIAKALAELREQAKTSQNSKLLFSDDMPIGLEQADQIKHHPLPFWIERMVLSYLESQDGASAQQISQYSWQLNWPDGEQWSDGVFQLDRDLNHEMTFVSLDQPKIQDLVMNIPGWIPSQLIPTVNIPTIPDTVNGVWSLWKISLDSQVTNHQQEVYLPIYTDQNTKSYPATAKRIWDALLSNQITLSENLAANFQSNEQTGLDNARLFHKQQQQAMVDGTALFNSLKVRYHQKLAYEKEKAEYAFLARRRVIDRIGLPEVRNHRLQILDQELKQWQTTFKERQSIMPDLKAVLLLRVMPI